MAQGNGVWCDCAFFVAFGTRRDRGFTHPQKRTDKKKSLQRYPGKVTLQAPHHHKEQSSWHLQMYQEYTAGAIRIHGECTLLLFSRD
jgi:hypothetical protein